MRFFSKYKKQNRTPVLPPKINKNPEKLLSNKLGDNLAEIHMIFSDTPDLIIRHLVIRQTEKQAALVYLSSITDSRIIFEHILTPLLFEEGKGNKESGSVVSLGHIKKTDTWEQVEEAILNGECVLFVDKSRDAFIYDTPQFPKRAIEESPLESSLLGAHVGFTEAGNDNIALIRQQIPNRELKIKEMTVGERGKSKVSILYLADVANPEVLKILEKRITNIKIDGILSSGYLAELIEDYPNAAFPQLVITERPDFAAAEILQGRYVVVVDRSPNVIIGPVTFDTFFKTMDDYGARWMVASFIRLMRFVGFLIAIFLPAIYIAIITFHFEVIPLDLLYSVAESRERIPFPPFIEAFLMELTLEMLREAGVRLPAKIGQTVGIVGGIVIGQAAVEAGIVSNIMVIVVALTAIASFIMPNYEMGSAVRIIRFPMMILASLFGFVGIVVGMMILLAQFISLESLGMPYGSPFAPLKLKDWKDSLIVFPQKSFETRPLSTKPLQLKNADFKRRNGSGRNES